MVRSERWLVLCNMPEPASIRDDKSGPAHSINLSPDNKFAFAADLGLDKVLIYSLDAQKAKLTPHNPPAGVVAPGSGPRHFAFPPRRQVRLCH